MPLNPSTYKPSVSKQQVIYWTNNTYLIDTLSKCSVVDLKNWRCRYNDESGEIGFKDGHFWETTLSNSSMINDFNEIKYVSKLAYRMWEFRWW